ERVKLIGRNPMATRRGTNWWLYASDAKNLFKAISGMKRVLVVAATSKTLAFVFVPTGIVYSHATYVFALDDWWTFAVLQCMAHECWARHYASTLKGDLRYTPSDCFETFPLPVVADDLNSIANDYYEYRCKIMNDRQEGLTKIYN